MCVWMFVSCTYILLFSVFFFKQKTAYEMRISDWSSDVCSSDLDRIIGDLADFTGEQREGLTDLTADLSTVGTILANRRTEWSQIIHYLPMASFGFARAINQDRGRWYLQPQVTGLLATPFLPNLNSRAGVGSAAFDNRQVPSSNSRNSLLPTLVPAPTE